MHPHYIIKIQPNIILSQTHRLDMNLMDWLSSYLQLPKENNIFVMIDENLQEFLY